MTKKESGFPISGGGVGWSMFVCLLLLTAVLFWVTRTNHNNTLAQLRSELAKPRGLVSRLLLGHARCCQEPAHIQISPGGYLFEIGLPSNDVSVLTVQLWSIEPKRGASEFMLYDKTSTVPAWEALLPKSRGDTLFVFVPPQTLRLGVPYVFEVYDPNAAEEPLEWYALWIRRGPPR